MLNIEHSGARDSILDSLRVFPRFDIPSFGLDFNKQEEKPMIINFIILYDNGRTYEVNKPLKTNVEKVTCSGTLVYTRKTRGLCVSSDYSVPMNDIAVIEVHYDNGDVKFRKILPCASFKVKMSKR